ncbi:MAG: hypothetical protein KC516_02050 [Nanoarchaeota archaeon]|nr:hypothetical protein [Nanoarchaeota archaeon]
MKQLISLISALFLITAISVAQTWDGSTSTDWHTASNWNTNSVPSSGANVVIPNVTNDPVINSSDVTLNNLTINSGAVLTVQSGIGLKVDGTFSEGDDPERLVLESGAFFFYNGTGAYGTYKIAFDQDQWEFIIVPVENQLLGIFSGMYVKTFDEPTNSWEYLTNPNYPLGSFEGFAVFSNSSSDLPEFLEGKEKVKGSSYSGDATKSPSEITVSGLFKTGSYSSGTLSYQDEGWNLMGNPYPTTLDWDASGGWTKNSTSTTYFVWNGDPNNSNLGAYVYHKSPFFIFPAEGTADRYIAVRQAFIGQAGSTSSSLGVNNSAKYFGSDFYWKVGQDIISSGILKGVLESPTDGDYISFKVNWGDETNPYSNEVMFRFYNHALVTFGYDLQADVPWLPSETLSEVYICDASQNMLINTLDDYSDGTMATLGLACDFSGTSEISIWENEIDGDFDVKLFDTKTHSYHYLTASDYSFSHTPLDNPVRFRIIFEDNSKSSEIITDEMDMQELSSGKFQLLNLMGQVVNGKIYQNIKEIREDQTLNSEIYLVIDKNSGKSQKILIK